MKLELTEEQAALLLRAITREQLVLRSTAEQMGDLLLDTTKEVLMEEAKQTQVLITMLKRAGADDGPTIIA